MRITSADIAQLLDANHISNKIVSEASSLEFGEVFINSAVHVQVGEDIKVVHEKAGQFVFSEKVPDIDVLIEYINFANDDLAQGELNSDIDFSESNIKRVINQIRTGNNANQAMVERLCNYLESNVQDIQDAFSD